MGGFVNNNNRAVALALKQRDVPSKHEMVVLDSIEVLVIEKQ